MKTRLTIALASLACLSAAKAPPAGGRSISGDYVEARTASVFCGACHYNGERVTTGRDAILAWRFTGGSWHGVDLAGAGAIAAVHADDNLAEPAAARRSELVLDGTSQQASAVAELLRVKAAGALGTVVHVRQARVQFDSGSDGQRITVADTADVAIRPMPNSECCSQPHLVWYEPLTPVQHRKVGFATLAAYTAGTVGDAWERCDENDAFYGTFAY